QSRGLERLGQQQMHVLERVMAAGLERAQPEVDVEAGVFLLQGLAELAAVGNLSLVGVGILFRGIEYLQQDLAEPAVERAQARDEILARALVGQYVRGLVRLRGHAELALRRIEDLLDRLEAPGNVFRVPPVAE